MNTRDELYRVGLEQQRLAAGDEEVSEPLVYSYVPGLGRMVTEILYGNIWARPGLTPRERSLATLSALAVRLRYQQLETEIPAALNRGAKPEEIIETLVMTIYYGGFTGAVPTLEIAQRVFDERGIALPDLPDEREIADLDEGGRNRRSQVQGGVFDESYPGIAELVPELGTIITRWGWGYIWGRPGLDLKSRMLVGIAGLASLGPAAEGPLPLFFRGAIRNGYTREQVVEILLQIMFYIGVPPALWSLGIAAEVLGTEAPPTPGLDE